MKLKGNGTVLEHPTTPSASVVGKLSVAVSARRYQPRGAGRGAGAERHGTWPARCGAHGPGVAALRFSEPRLRASAHAFASDAPPFDATHRGDAVRWLIDRF